MTRALSLTLSVTALLALAATPAGAQTPSTGQLRAAPTFAGRAAAPAPDRIGLVNVQDRLSDFGGLYVHMSVVEIDDVLSPRLFTIRRPLQHRYESFDEDTQVLLLLDAPLPALTHGTQVQVTGWVTTAPSATVVMGKDWGPGPDDGIYADMNRPLVLANIVRSLDGVELASRP